MACTVLGLDDLDIIAKCVGGQGLAAVCRLLAEDFSGWAGVPPDAPLLILLRQAQQHSASLLQACMCMCISMWSCTFRLL